MTFVIMRKYSISGIDSFHGNLLLQIVGTVSDDVRTMIPSDALKETPDGWMMDCSQKREGQPIRSRGGDDSSEKVGSTIAQVLQSYLYHCIKRYTQTSRRTHKHYIDFVSPSTTKIVTIDYIVVG
jgi:hypothetical protein